MPLYYVYIVECVDSKGRHQFYTGYTKDLQRRILEHSNGKGAKFCRNKEISLRYFETFSEQGEAMKRELEIKSFPKKKKIELINTIEI